MAGCGDMTNEFARQVMELSLRKYKSLPKKGKPQRGQEWTPLATVLSCEGILVHRSKELKSTHIHKTVKGHGCLKCTL